MKEGLVGGVKENLGGGPKGGTGFRWGGGLARDIKRGVKTLNMSYISVNWQHNEGKCSLILKNIILLVKNLNKYWDIARKVRRKFISGIKNFWMGGTSLAGREYPLTHI